jgi:hypothetical protein
MGQSLQSENRSSVPNYLTTYTPIGRHSAFVIQSSLKRSDMRESTLPRSFERFTAWRKKSLPYLQRPQAVVSADRLSVPQAFTPNRAKTFSKVTMSTASDCFGLRSSLRNSDLRARSNRASSSFAYSDKSRKGPHLSFHHCSRWTVSLTPDCLCQHLKVCSTKCSGVFRDTNGCFRLEEV